MSAHRSAAVIFGCGGTELTEEERRFFRDADPFGFILFKRNCASPQQIAALTAELRASVGRSDAPVLIDQEGGRVQRLGPPQWRKAPPAALFGQLYDHDPVAGLEATALNARLIAEDLYALGIDVDCAPVLDLRHEGAHDIVGDRAFHSTPKGVVALAKAFAGGLRAGGVVPIVKHVPGHGRAHADSHLSCPVVDASLDALKTTDFAPFQAFGGDAVWGMTAHIIYADIDRDRPATLSARMIGTVIRDMIGFQGLLLSDDLSMAALDGTYADRAKGSLDAGCDVVLHCNGDLGEMQGVMEGTAKLDDAAMTRLAATSGIRPTGDFDREAALARLDQLLPAAIPA